MNLHAELDRLTQPPMVAGAVRGLSAEEIEAIVSVGEVTPLELVPQAHMLPKGSCPWQR